jgi:hypothetical protein
MRFNHLLILCRRSSRPYILGTPIAGSAGSAGSASSAGVWYTGVEARCVLRQEAPVGRHEAVHTRGCSQLRYQSGDSMHAVVRLDRRAENGSRVERRMTGGGWK